MKAKQETSRRKFLKHAARAASAAIAIPYLVPAAALGRGGLVAPSERITIGSIGVGSMGEVDVKALMQCQGVQILAVCDVFRDRREKVKGIVDAKQGSSDCQSYGDFREVLARKDIDAINITTQDHWHAVIATAAAHAAKDIHCQKPLGISVEECQAIRDAVRCTNECSRPVRNNALTGGSARHVNWHVMAIWENYTRSRWERRADVQTNLRPADDARADPRRL